MKKKHGSGRHRDSPNDDEYRASSRAESEPSPPAGHAAELDAEHAARDLELAEHSDAANEHQVDDLRRERDEYLSSWQRSQADYQNLRRRLQSDVDAAVNRAQVPLLQDLLLVMDYLEMALATPCATQDCKNVLAGVELTKSVLTRALDRANVRPVPESESFDSTTQQAVQRTETSDSEPGRVLQTLRRGYTHDGQVLRPAQVRVAVAPTTGDAPRSSDRHEDQGPP